jgi:DNA polymerase-1
MNVTLIETADQFEKALAAFRKSDGMLAFDTETSGLQVRSVHGDVGRTIQFSWRPWTEAVVIELTPKWHKPIQRFFFLSEEIVGFNTKFDQHVMANYEIDLWSDMDPLLVHDARWAARLNDERDRASLKALSDKYVDSGASAEQGKLKRVMKKNGWDWGTVPISYLIEYGGTDAIITGRLFDFLYPRIGHSLDAYRREQRLNPVLIRMERAGIKIDRGLLNRVTAEERGKTEDAKEVLQRIVPGINPNSAIQIKSAFRDRGIEVEDTTAATMKRISGSSELARAILTYRGHAKTLSTYAEPWGRLVTPEGRIHPSFNSMGASTGRFSSDNPNLQNITRGHRLRDIFIAGPGHKLVVADWNQMELRLYAHFAEDEAMRAAFLSGDDIYQQVADLLGVPRQVGKMLMLASIYGAGPAKIGAQVINMAWQYDMGDLVPMLETYDWPDLWSKFHARYKIRDLARLTELQARRRGNLGEAYIRTLGGRRQRPKQILMPEVNGHRQMIELYKDLGNCLVQGSSADLMKQALIHASDAGLGDMLRLTVHDEMVLEVPDAEVEPVMEILEKVMTRREFVPPLTIGTSFAQNYGDAK